MRPSHVCGRTLAGSLIAFGVGLAVVPIASADPTDAAPTDQPAPGPAPGVVTDAAPPGQPAPPPAPDAPVSAAPDSADPTTADACKQFGAALDYASSHYEDFAYDAAGGGNNVNYDSPNTEWDNVAGRTALREAAASALSASTTPGLSPDIASPMQAWSLGATKLLLVMGVHGGGDTLNSTASKMNTDAHNAQMACAAAGTHA